MLALIVITTIAIAGAFMLIGKHAQKGFSYTDGPEQHVVLTTWLAAILHGLLVWWVIASVPESWASIAFLVSFMLSTGLSLARAYVTEGRFTRRLPSTILGLCVSVVIYFGLWSSVLDK